MSGEIVKTQSGLRVSAEAQPLFPTYTNHITATVDRDNLVILTFGSVMAKVQIAASTDTPSPDIITPVSAVVMGISTVNELRRILSEVVQEAEREE